MSLSHYAGVAELADAQDLKSCCRNTVPVRFRSPALDKDLNIDLQFYRFYEAGKHQRMDVFFFLCLKLVIHPFKCAVCRKTDLREEFCGIYNREKTERSMRSFEK